MILWNSKIKLTNGVDRIICKLSDQDDVLCYHPTIPAYSGGLDIRHQVKAVSKKAPRRTPYRLRTENFLIDTYLTNTFLVKKPNRDEPVFSRLCDIRDDYEFCLLRDDDGQFINEKFKSLLQDPALMRMYTISTNCDSDTQAIVANGFIIKLEKK